MFKTQRPTSSIAAINAAGTENIAYLPKGLVFPTWLYRLQRTPLAEWLAKLRMKHESLRKPDQGDVSQFSILNSQFKVAWVSLDTADSDPVRFWSYVIAALDMLQPNSGAIALALLQSPQPPQIEAVLTPLLNALSALPVDAVLVLDDYHLIDAPPIHSALAFLLEHLPPQLHLMLTTRADPPLPLTRLMSPHS